MFLGSGVMKHERSVRILVSGMLSGVERLFKQGKVREDEYPRSFHKLYNTLEDEVYEMFLAIERKDLLKIYACAGNVVARASMIAEYAETTARKRGLLEDKENAE
jgi:hypothetical protein